MMRVAVILGVLVWAGAAGRSGEETVRSAVCTVPAKNGWAVNYPKQRKLFCMAGRFWVFYSDGRDGVCRTSADGVRWGDPFLVRKGACPESPSCCMMGA